ncbi:MAG TPA: GNAT family N-acetyltransferase [Candidatus Acidoferrales bacterium]
MIELRTERLLLRRWRDSDREPFFRINSDPRVMEFLPRLFLREESDQMIDRCERHFEDNGFGLFAVEIVGGAPFIGYIGLSAITFSAPFTPSIEIGWRLAHDHWSKGLATEGAREVVRCAFKELKIDSLVSFTSVTNVRSRRVMEKLGMTHDPAEDFDHPGLSASHPLRHHVLYRLRRP